MAGEFPAQRDSSAENVSIWWRHHDSSLPMSRDHFSPNISQKTHLVHPLGRDMDVSWIWSLAQVLSSKLLCWVQYIVILHREISKGYSTNKLVWMSIQVFFKMWSANGRRFWSGQTVLNIQTSSLTCKGCVPSFTKRRIGCTNCNRGHPKVLLRMEMDFPSTAVISAKTRDVWRLQLSVSYTLRFSERWLH